MVAGFIHSCTVRRKVRNYSLLYDGGSKVFTAGKTLTGATSHATAIIISTGVAASGTLVLHTISGTFQNNEVLSDNGIIPGAALADGVIFDTLDSYGQITFTDVDATVSCRFFSSKDVIRISGGALYGETTLKVMLPGDTTVAKGDQIISTVIGFIGTFKIDSAPAAYALGSIPHHFTCDIARVS